MSESTIASLGDTTFGSLAPDDPGRSETWSGSVSELGKWLNAATLDGLGISDSSSWAPERSDDSFSSTEDPDVLASNRLARDPFEQYEAQDRARRTVRAPSVGAPPHLEALYRGAVTEVGDGYFSAEVKNGDPTAPSLIAEFDIDDLPEDDRSDLQPGALIHVTVASDRSRRGRPTRVTAIRLQRVRRWPTEDLDAARQRAAGIMALLSEYGEDAGT